LLKLFIVQAEYGDCFLLQSSDSHNAVSILVDGGPSHTYERSLKPTLDAILPNKNLDLVVLSHIDNDHVLGLLELFEAITDQKESRGSEIYKIGCLWHNSFPDLIASTDNLNKFMRSIKSSNDFTAIGDPNTISEISALGALKGVSEGKDLTKLAEALNIPINPQFDGDIITTDRKVIGIDGLNIHILGPTPKNLEKLRKTWDDWLKSHPQSLITPEDYGALQILDASITNLSSIMFMVESKGRKLLFAGDGLGRDIVEVLSEENMLNTEGRIHVDILKVPHHGSERNSSEQFFETVTADIYIISANGRDDNPSFSTLEWIIESGKQDDRNITIVATNKTENIEKIEQVYDPEKFQYNIKFLDPQHSFLEINVNNN
jgi:ribonuclease BN (tRNA processing enzyme)